VDQGQPGKVITIKDEKADAAPPAKTLEAEYHRPVQMHGSIGPSCAVAHNANDRLTVWSHAQGMFPLRDAIAELLKLPKEKVRCIHVEGSGCYGHNGADDVAADAAYLAFATPGIPVREVDGIPARGGCQLIHKASQTHSRKRQALEAPRLLAVGAA
jgi:CO/xanthine dehydrogenase Mo-binding subunit